MTSPSTTLTIGGDLTVGRLGFGAMRLTGPGIGGPPADVPGALKVARRAVELGITFPDTADSYGPGTSEELPAEALHPYPEDLVIATKAGQSRPAPGRWIPLGRPEHLCQQAELNLRRLRLERIDLFQLHRIDPKVPLTEQPGAETAPGRGHHPPYGAGSLSTTAPRAPSPRRPPTPSRPGSRPCRTRPAGSPCSPRDSSWPSTTAVCCTVGRPSPRRRNEAEARWLRRCYAG